MGRNIGSGQFAEVISLVLYKYGSKLPQQEKQDLQQEAELALFSAKKDLENHEAPERLAYKIVKNRTINCLKKLPPRMEDIDDPKIRRKYDHQAIQYPDMDVKLDAEKAVHLVNQLPATDKFILIMTFGLEDNPQFTEKELATLLGKSEDWVNRIKKQALVKLRAIMER